MNDIVLNYREELVYSLIVLVILIFIQFILKKAANKVGKKSEINITRTRLMFKYINILVVLIAAFLMALAWGVGIAELALIFSSVFAVIGVALFAIWSILSNITSGIILFFSFPYKIGDTILPHNIKIFLTSSERAARIGNKMLRHYNCVINSTTYEIILSTRKTRIENTFEKKHGV